MIRDGEPEKILLVSSRADPAGSAIHREILAYLDSTPDIPGGRQYEHLVVSGRLIEQDFLDEGYTADTLIFLSRHASRNPVPILTVHPTGNFADAGLGGKPGSLPPTSPAWMHAVLHNLQKLAPGGYRVSYEATHHGPTELHVPSFFAEIGSTEKEWTDPEAVRAVAISVVTASPVPVVPLVGFGGNHYMARQTRIALTTPGAFGHMSPAEMAARLTAADIRNMAAMSVAAGAYIDRKSLSAGDVTRIEQMVADAELEILQTEDLLALNAVSWKTFLRIRALVAELGPGARPHIHAMGAREDPLTVVCLDSDLFAAAYTANEGMVLRGLEKLPLAHISGPKGAILPVFITYGDEAGRILDDLITLCVSTITVNEKAAIDGDHIVIRKIRFDPGKARELGIPAGPLFSRLMNGEPVKIGGRVVTPDLVQRTTEKRIHIPGLERFT